MKKKILTVSVLLVSALFLVAASVLGTLAFLASSSAVSNTFTVGDVGINMLESETNEDGEDLDGAGIRTKDSNSYRLVPGKTYTKDPAIIVKENSVPSYLFVKVKNGIASIEDPANTMAAQMVANGWQLVKENNITHEKLYLYVGAGNAAELIDTDAVDAELVGTDVAQTIELFNNFKVLDEIPADIILGDFAGAKVTLTAFAIQNDGFDEAEDGLEGYQLAWNAIVNRFPFESGTVFEAPAAQE